MCFAGGLCKQECRWGEAGRALEANTVRAVEEREFCPVNLDPNDCDPPLLLPIRRQTTSAWALLNCQG